MKRGELVMTALRGAYGKPQMALVIQSNLFSEHPSVTILQITDELKQAPLFRMDIIPTPENGLKHKSQVMIDKAQTVPQEKIGMVFGKLDDTRMLEINRALAVWFGFA